MLCILIKHFLLLCKQHSKKKNTFFLLGNLFFAQRLCSRDVWYKRAAKKKKKIEPNNAITRLLKKIVYT